MKDKKNYHVIIGVVACLLLYGILVYPQVAKAATTHTCTVIFVTDGGTDVPTRVVDQGTYLSSLPTPKKDGYTFAGWYSNSSLTIKISDGSYYLSVSSTDTVLVLYAKWTKITAKSIVAVYGDKTAYVESSLDRTKITVTALYSDGTTGTVTDFTISNLVVSYIGYNYYTVTYDNCMATFVVIGIARQYYTVSFVSNGGTSEDTISGVLGGDTIILPKDPKRSGYTFAGWYQDSSFTLSFTSKTPVTYNMTLYAKWEKDVVEDSTVNYKLDKSAITLQVDQEDYVIVGSYNPDTANYIEYTSSNPSVVAVYEDGKILGKKYGKATIYVVVESQLLKCAVTVSTEQPITKITPSVTKKSLKKGKSFTIRVKITPSDAIYRKLKYSSSDTSIAKVTSKGKVTAKKKGTCYITIKTLDGTNIKKRVKIVVR